VKVFIDTSALISIIDQDQPAHVEASALWESLCEAHEGLLTSNYVLVETFAIVQKRFGLSVARALHERIAPVLQVVWVTPELHDRAWGHVLAEGSRQLSLIDTVSFDIIEREEATHVLSFDKHFVDRGFRLPPLTNSRQ